MDTLFSVLVSALRWLLHAVGLRDPSFDIDRLLFLVLTVAWLPVLYGVWVADFFTDASQRWGVMIFYMLIYAVCGATIYVK